MSSTRRSENRYQFLGVDLSGIRNRNEFRVIRLLPEVLEQYPEVEQNVVNIQDIYALALNLLPARYTQQFSIVLKDPVSGDEVKDALRQAIERVRDNPTGPARQYEME
ncbi:MAG: late competence development ComFB family protein [Desulfosalsimonas sp.]|uniref:late competence development ComFB family protein n=1 Tax=Desulfosalsimonas sp. TaxID=3073848 RepID=UPI003970A386